MPLIFALTGLISGGTAVLARRQSNARIDSIGIVDDSGLVQFQLLPALQRMTIPVDAGAGPLARKAADAASRGSQINFTKFDSAGTARAAFLRKEIRGYSIIPRDYLESGKLELSLRRGALMSSSQPGWDLLRRLIAASLFFFIRMAAKLFRLGTLMYGKRPSAVEIARWLKEAREGSGTKLQIIDASFEGLESPQFLAWPARRRPCGEGGSARISRISLVTPVSMTKPPVFQFSFFSQLG